MSRGRSCQGPLRSSRALGGPFPRTQTFSLWRPGGRRPLTLVLLAGVCWSSSGCQAICMHWPSGVGALNPNFRRGKSGGGAIGREPRGQEAAKLRFRCKSVRRSRASPVQPSRRISGGERGRQQGNLSLSPGRLSAPTGVLIRSCYASGPGFLVSLGTVLAVRKPQETRRRPISRAVIAAPRTDCLFIVISGRFHRAGGCLQLPPRSFQKRASWPASSSRLELDSLRANLLDVTSSLSWLWGF